MTKNRAWVLANRQTDAAALAVELESLLGFPCAGFSLQDWHEQQLPRACPTVIIADLRAPELWSHLRALREGGRKLQGKLVPFIGIVDQGLPPDRVVLAEQTLAGVVCAPLPLDGWKDILQKAQQQERIRAAEQEGGCRLMHGGPRKFLTYTPALFPLLDDLEMAARCDFTVLLVGETGTGKTTLARMLHDLSARKDERFLPVACGSLPDELIDSELFGHVRGAFTGADKNKEGKFEVAGQGTILLDEIDVLGLSQQAKLLRVLETGEFEPLGCNETRQTCARTVAASNLCLEMLVQQERFRADLFYRLNQVKFEVPPLRLRPLDILPLAMDAIEECSKEHNLPPRRIHPDFIQALKLYSWPGNIRELRNEVRRAVLFARDGIVSPQTLSLSMLNEVAGKKRAGMLAPTRSGLANEVAQTEQEMIETMLRKQDFNRAATARALGISRVTLYNKLRKYGIQSPEEDDKKSPPRLRVRPAS